MTNTELHEFEWETGQKLLDESVSAHDLIRHNSSIDNMRGRARDEQIDKMVRTLADKTDIDQNLTGVHDFAARGCGRIYPENLKQDAILRLMEKYENE